MVVSRYSKQDMSPNTFLGIVWSGQNSPVLTNFPVALHTSCGGQLPTPTGAPARKVMVWGSPLVQDPLPQDKCSFPALAAPSNSASRELSTWRTVRAGRLQATLSYMSHRRAGPGSSFCGTCSGPGRALFWAPISQ